MDSGSDVSGRDMAPDLKSVAMHFQGIDEKEANNCRRILSTIPGINHASSNAKYKIMLTTQWKITMKILQFANNKYTKFTHDLRKNSMQCSDQIFSIKLSAPDYIVPLSS